MGLCSNITNVFWFLPSSCNQIGGKQEKHSLMHTFFSPYSFSMVAVSLISNAFFLKQRMKNVYAFLYDGIQHSLMLVFSAVVHWGSKLDLRGDSCFDNI